MNTFFMDLEFLCDQHQVFEDQIIAICVLSDTDETFEIFSYVRPTPDAFLVSNYCTTLTGITQAQLEDQPTFDDLYDHLLEAIAADDVIYVWGNTDLEAIYKASLELSDELEFTIVDFQQEFIDFCGYRFRPGLKKVYEALTDDTSTLHHDVRSDTNMLREIFRIFHADKKAAMRKVKSRIK